MRFFPVGVSYVQVLLVFTIIAFAAALTAPLYLQYQGRQQLHTTAQTLLSDIRLTQQKAMQQYLGDVWGIHLDNASHTYTIFYSSSYNPSDSRNFTVPYSSALSVTPVDDVAFTAVTGVPTSPTTITLQSSRINESRTITINEQGATDLD